MSRDYQELPAREGALLPAPAPPPKRTVHLGKPGARFINERLVGRIEEAKDGHSFQLRVNGRRMSAAKLCELLRSYVNFDIELTVFQDHDPDVIFRMSEGMEGLKGTYEWEDYSIYVSRLKTELRLAFPDREYSVQLKGETLQIGRKAEKPRFRLKSPVLGEWILTDTSGRDEEFFSFIDAVEEVIALETS